MSYPVSLSLQKDQTFKDTFESYRAEVRSTVSANLERARRSRYVKQRLGVFADPNYARLFTLTGALQVRDLAELNQASRFFQLNYSRYFHRGGKFILRGKRYLAAIDPGLSVPQMIQVYIEDLHESIALLEELATASTLDQVKSLAPLLDYAKNSIVTLTNAFLHEEKRGRTAFDNDYLQLRSELIASCQLITGAFYSSLLGTLNPSSDLPRLRTVLPSVKQTVARMLAEYKSGSLSAREFVRPEASHPLVLLAFSSLFDEGYKASAVVGLPSGSTELACLLAEAMSPTRVDKCPLYLLPYSRHSMRVQFGTASDGTQLQRIYENCYLKQPLGPNVLLVDDNSSSGATLDAVRAFLASVAPSASVEVGVAEADLRRSALDLKVDSKRSHYAAPSVYKHSVGILPVAKRLWRKHDLKEVSESFLLANHYATLTNPSIGLLEAVRAEVSAEAARRPFARKAAEQEWAKTSKRERFRDTFLSNFWPVRLLFRGREFSTVEHAYQWVKFDENVLRGLSTAVRLEIGRALGVSGGIDLPGVFSSSHHKPGFVKRLAEILVDRGLQRDNWDDFRVDRMIELTLRKYSNPDLKARLLATGEDYLLEGNDWGDVFWGACLEGDKYRGRNMLGLILMNVREKIRFGQL